MKNPSRLSGLGTLSLLVLRDPVKQFQSSLSRMMFFSNNKYFILNKILSLGITSLILFIVSRLDSIQGQWAALTLTIIVLGQGHFISTYVYHFKSLPQKLTDRRHWIIYISFVIFSGYMFGVVRWEYRLDTFIMGFVGLYFLFHHILNERTLATYDSKSPTNYYLETIFIFALVAVVFLPTLNSGSFSFLLAHNVLLLENLSQLSTYSTVQIISPHTETAYSVCVLAFFLLYCYKNFKKGKYKIAVMGGLTALSFALAYLRIFQDFLYFFAFIILFHYLTWFFFFFLRLSKEHRFIDQHKQYNSSHLLIYSSLFILFIVGQYSQPGVFWNVYYIVFSLNFFMFWTFLHITVTLINEKPIERFLKGL